MSFRKSTRYTLKCDTCGRLYRQEGAARPTVGTRQSLLNRARQDDWQTNDDYQYCPEHWHVACRKCGKSAVAPLNRLEQDGWVNAVPGPLPARKYGDVRHDLTYAPGWGVACPQCATWYEYWGEEERR